MARLSFRPIPGKKHSIYLVAEGDGAKDLFDFIGLGFSSAKKKIERPVAPRVSIAVNGKSIDVPATPVRSTNANGIVGYDLYETKITLPANTNQTPVVSASADNNAVKVAVIQAESTSGTAVVKCNYKGIVKTYKIVFAVE